MNSIIHSFAVLLLCAFVAPALGADFDATCRVRSGYDFTLSEHRLDTLESAMSAALPGGGRLNLLEVAG